MEPHIVVINKEYLYVVAAVAAAACAYEFATIACDQHKLCL